MLKLSPNNSFVRHFSHRTIRLGHTNIGIMGDTSLAELKKFLKPTKISLQKRQQYLAILALN